MTWLPIALLAWPLLAAGLLLAWRKPLLALWREPVFKAPILIVESDDWGAGPLAQAESLAAIAECLARQRDASGRPAVMTLALVLAVPEPGSLSDFGIIGCETAAAAHFSPASCPIVGLCGGESGKNCARWGRFSLSTTKVRQAASCPLSGPLRRQTLADPALQPILEAIRAGQARGVFALQLHGMEHFWPESLLAAARKNPAVAAWLAVPELTEHLPSPLQSRWTDAAALPSRPLSRPAVAAAVAEETRLYAVLFGVAPEVVVPPTFVWTQDVESAWAAQGVRVLITPGRRLTGRDGEGRPADVDRDMRNGEHGEGGVIYLVRDDYFEPSFGHRPEQALAALARKTALGRPCLLETHRGNFLVAAGGDPAAALAALDDLYTRALRDFPTLRFASCAELGRAIRTGDAAWIEQDGQRRFTIWLRRAATLPRFGKAAHLAGLLPLLNLFARLARP